MRLLTIILSFAFALAAQAQEPSTRPLRCGIIGLDTSHVIAFTTTLNTKNYPNSRECASSRPIRRAVKTSPAA